MMSNTLEKYSAFFHYYYLHHLYTKELRIHRYNHIEL
jgi:hypothetical protein